MSITWANGLINDDGSGQTGTLLNKAQFQAFQADIQDEVDRPFGEVWSKNNVNPTVIDTAGTYFQFVFFDNNGLSNECTPDQANSHIEIDEDGIYEIICTITSESAAPQADEIGFQIYKNNGVTGYDNMHIHRKLSGGGGDTGAVPLGGLASLTSGDTIELWVENEDNGNNVILSDVNLRVKKMKDL